MMGHDTDSKYFDNLKPFCRSVFICRSNYKINLLTSLFRKKPLSVSNFYKKSLQHFVDDTLEKEGIDAIICFCSSMAEYIFQTPRFKSDNLGSVKLIMDYVDLDSDKWLQYSRYTRFLISWIYGLENKRLLEYEKKINKAFDHSVFVAQREVDIFAHKFTEIRNITVIPNGVRQDFFYPQPDSNGRNEKETEIKESPVLVFTGVMDYLANEDGVIWFSSRIFPIIKQEFPEIRFIIVGNRPTRKIRKLENIKGITVTGFVDNIREYYWMADICVIPLRIARGLQNKVLEAMACRKPVIATSNASKGILCDNEKDIIIADTESEFAEQVIRLLKNRELRQKLADNALENIRANYRWEKKIEMLEDLLVK
jgi:sugar transferase (PEP-CTERM/EpsH1 system associated)